MQSEIGRPPDSMPVVRCRSKGLRTGCQRVPPGSTCPRARARPRPRPHPPDALYALAESVGVSPDPEVFDLLLELVRRDVKTSAIVQMLRGMKDTKIRSALSRQSPSG